MSNQSNDEKKYLIKNNMSGETIATATDLELAKQLAEAGGVWLYNTVAGEFNYRWYVQDDETGKVIYSPKDRESK